MSSWISGTSAVTMAFFTTGSYLAALIGLPLLLARHLDFSPTEVGMVLLPEALATAMKFELEDGHVHWLGLHNFYVITRYNHSAMYAMAVYQLAEAIAARYAGKAG